MASIYLIVSGEYEEYTIHCWGKSHDECDKAIDELEKMEQDKGIHRSEEDSYRIRKVRDLDSFLKKKGLLPQGK